MREVKNIILTLGVLDIFKKTKFEHDFNPVELWKHSIAVGVITRNLGAQLGVKNLENILLPELCTILVNYYFSVQLNQII